LGILSTERGNTETVAPGARLRAMLAKNYGFTPGALEGVGALFLICGALEYHLESAIWRLSGETPKGQRPSTDRKPVSELLKSLVKEAEKISGQKWLRAVGLLRATIQNILDYRHAIAHGFISLNGTTILNWCPSGEVRRDEPRIAYVDERLVGLIADCIVTVIETLEKIAIAPDSNLVAVFVSQTAALQRAQSISSEVVNLLEYMNAEKN
jgi:hypothetical protein